MKKNYKRYWALLKEAPEGKLTLAFEHACFQTIDKMKYEVSLWKAGFSREKYKDFSFQTKNPSYRLGFTEHTDWNEGITKLEVELYNDATISKNNPKIIL